MMRFSRTADLETRAELEKLVAELKLDDATLNELAGAGAINIRRLRQSIQQKRHARKRAGFRKLAGLVRWLPKTYVAKLAQTAFGAELSGRVVGQMDPIRASRIARLLPPAFLADAAAAAEPERAREIIQLLPADVIRDAALILFERKDYILMGRFADALSAPAIRQVVASVPDDAALLQVAFFMEDKTQLGRILQMVDNERIATIMQTGMREDLWPQALSIIDNVSNELRARLANIMAAQDAETLNDLVSVAHRENLWGPVLRGLAQVNPKHYRKIVNLPAVRDEALLGDLITSAHEENLLEVALPLAERMRAEHQKTVAHAALKQGDELAEAALWAAHNSGRWDVLLELAQHLDDEERNVLARLPIARNRKVLRSLLSSAARAGRIPLLLDFAKRFEPEGLQLVVEIALENSADLLETIIASARTTPGGWDALAVAISSVHEENTLREIGAVYREQYPDDREAFKAAVGESWNRIGPLLEAA